MTVRKAITWNGSRSPSQSLGIRSDGVILVHIGAHPSGPAAGAKAATASGVEGFGTGLNMFVPLDWIASEYDEIIALESHNLNLRRLVQLKTWRDHALPAYRMAGEALK